MANWTDTQVIKDGIEVLGPCHAGPLGQIDENLRALGEGDGKPGVYVSRNALRVATWSASGTIAAGAVLTVSMPHNSFFPAVRIDGSAVQMVHKQGGTNPGWAYWNQSGADQAYSISTYYLY